MGRHKILLIYYVNTDKRDKMLFCADYLKKSGIDNFQKYNNLLQQVSTTPIPKFEIKRVNQNDTFFTDCAEGLRNLWPQGTKAGKYPWRDSTNNLAIRLKTMWRVMGLEDSDYTVEDVLAAGRRYINEFQHKDTTYMKTLKYFILKQKEITDNTGKITYTNESQLAEMLEDTIRVQGYDSDVAGSFDVGYFDIR